MKILCLGHSTYDTIFPVTEYPKENTKTRYSVKSECAGGPSTTAAFLLAKWNMQVYMAGIVGNDHYGQRIKKDLALNRVNTDYLQVSDECSTSHSVGLANEVTGSRTLFIYNPKDTQMNDFELDFEPDIILIDGYEYEASKKVLKKYPKAISIIDAGREKKEIIELAKMTSYVVCSKDFAESLSEIKIDFENKQTLVAIYQKLETIFNNKIIVTLEEEGCLYRLDNKIKLMPAIKVKTVDSTGAGDIFHGTFTYALANGFDLEKALKYSNIAGALAVTKMGSYNAIPSLEELEEVYEQIK